VYAQFSVSSFYSLTFLQIGIHSMFGSYPACVHDEYEKHARSRKSTPQVNFYYIIYACARPGASPKSCR